MPFDPDRKRTKIVATIGPASYDPDNIRKMIRAGMDVARINFSHGTHDFHAQVIKNVRDIAREENAVVAILGDLQGPKIRMGDFRTLAIKPGDTLTLTCRDDFKQDDKELPLPHTEFIKDVQPGQRLLLADGEFEFKVTKKSGHDITCEVVVGGDLSSRKGVSAPDSTLTLDALTDKDRTDLVFALKQKVDWIAMSFVRQADDIRELRWLIRQYHGDAGIIAKIEKFEALQSFDDILELADGIMVARGDLGVEIDPASVPIHQKHIIAQCNRAGKPVITATQMLNSMIENPRPTRAEASDVANAIFDGTDAVMLSAESASGSYPVESVEMMHTIARIAEANLESLGNVSRFARQGAADTDNLIADAISHATMEMAAHVGARMIVTSTWTGYTARQVARERPRTPILCATPNLATYRRMALVWGVVPILVPEFETIDDMIDVIVQASRTKNLVESGDLLVIIAGVPFGEGSHTNLIKIHTVQ